MGAIQEPIPAMDGWGVETRTESAYLSDSIAEMDGPGRFTVRADGVTMSATHLPRLLACVELAWDWAIRHHAAEAGGVRPIKVTRDGPDVVITGDITAPSLGYARGEGLPTVHMLEPTYAELPGLYRQLNDALAQGLASLPEDGA